MDSSKLWNLLSANRDAQCAMHNDNMADVFCLHCNTFVCSRECAANHIHAGVRGIQANGGRLTVRSADIYPFFEQERLAQVERSFLQGIFLQTPLLRMGPPVEWNPEVPEIATHCVKCHAYLSENNHGRKFCSIECMVSRPSYYRRPDRNRKRDNPTRRLDSNLESSQ